MPSQRKALTCGVRSNMDRPIRIVIIVAIGVFVTMLDRRRLNAVIVMDGRAVPA